MAKMNPMAIFGIIILSLIFSVILVTVFNVIFGIPLGILFFFMGINGFYVTIGLGFVLFVIFALALRGKARG